MLSSIQEYVWTTVQYSDNNINSLTGVFQLMKATMTSCRSHFRFDKVKEMSL